MKQIIFFILLLLCVFEAKALGLAVSPSHLVFNENNQSLIIINPNDIDIRYSINSSDIQCNPSNSQLRAKQKVILNCYPRENPSLESYIMVKAKETKKKESIGIIPAVAIRATIEGGETKGLQSSLFLEEDNRRPLLVDDTVKVDSPHSHKSKRSWSTITIGILMLMIVLVLIYTEIRDRKINSSDETLQSDAPADQSFASDEASLDQTLKPLEQILKV